MLRCGLFAGFDCAGFNFCNCGECGTPQLSPKKVDSEKSPTICELFGYGPNVDVWKDEVSVGFHGTCQIGFHSPHLQE